jgi:phosphatidylserine decarboxylase
MTVSPANTPGSRSKWAWPSVHPEGRKFIIIAAVVAVIFLFFISDEIGFPLVALTFGVAAFFRDPVRVTPQGDGLIVAPADGLVTHIATVPPPRELAHEGALGPADVTRVSIFMSVFDVHVNRSPIAGTIQERHYIAGAFVNADLDKASEDNERQHFLVVGNDGLKVGFTQIAGLIARRIVAFAKPGDVVAAGQRIGLIRFGSRVDVFLPAGTLPHVIAGQRTIAGETIIAIAGDGKVRGGIAQ